MTALYTTTRVSWCGKIKIAKHEQFYSITNRLGTNTAILIALHVIQMGFIRYHKRNCAIPPHDLVLKKNLDSRITLSVLTLHKTVLQDIYLLFST